MQGRILRLLRAAGRVAPWVQLAGALAIVVAWASVDTGWIDAEPRSYPASASYLRLAGTIALLVAAPLALFAPGRWRGALRVLFPIGGAALAVAAMWLCGVCPRPFGTLEIEPYSFALASAAVVSLLAITRDAKGSLPSGTSGLAAIGAFSVLCPVRVGYDYIGHHPVLSAAPSLAFFLTGAAGCAWYAAFAHRSTRLATVALAIALTSRATTAVVESWVDVAIHTDQLDAPPSFSTYERLAIACDALEALTALAVVVLLAALAWRMLDGGSVGRRARAGAVRWAPAGLVIALLATDAFAPSVWPTTGWRSSSALWLTSEHRRQLSEDRLIVFGTPAEPITFVLADELTTVGDVRALIGRPGAPSRFLVTEVPAIVREAPRAMLRWPVVEAAALRSQHYDGVRVVATDRAELDRLRASECVRDLGWRDNNPYAEPCPELRCSRAPTRWIVVIPETLDDFALFSVEPPGWFELALERPPNGDAEVVSPTAFPRARHDGRFSLVLALAIVAGIVLLGARILVELLREQRSWPNGRFPNLPRWASLRDVTFGTIDGSGSYRSRPRMVALYAPPLRSLVWRIAPIARWTIVRAGALVAYCVALAILLRLTC